MKCLSLCCLVLLGCGGDPISPETDVLSNFMSIANVRRDPIHNATGDITGIDLSAEIINTGPVPIISPVIMTWKLRGPNSEEIARATHRFAKFDVGQAQGIALTMTFAPRPNLAGVQDVVTFDFEDSSQQSVTPPIRRTKPPLPKATASNHHSTWSQVGRADNRRLILPCRIKFSRVYCESNA